MIFPIQELIEFNGNIYEITCACSRRAYQLAKLQDPILKENGDKVVSVAAKQIFSGDIEYRLEEKTGK